METRLLRYFLTVAHEENITRTAEVLHITQPTLSRQLVQLEEETGVTLFIRGKRKITLTPEGMPCGRNFIAGRQNRKRTSAAGRACGRHYFHRLRRIKFR